MRPLHNTCEIIESGEELDSKQYMKEAYGKCCIVNSGQIHSIDDDINQLFAAIDLKTSVKARDASRKSALKRPMRVGSPAHGIGISDSGSLKQALRGLCISQASEMAAMRRLSKPVTLSGSSDAGTIKSLYRMAVVDPAESSLPLNEGKSNLVEVSLVPESSSAGIYGNVPGPRVPTSMSLNQNDSTYTTAVDVTDPLATEFGTGTMKVEAGVSFGRSSRKNLVPLGENVSTSVEVSDEPSTSMSDARWKGKMQVSSSSSVKATGGVPRVLKGHKFVNKQVKQESAVAARPCNPCHKNSLMDTSPITGKLVCRTHKCSTQTQRKENEKASMVPGCSHNSRIHDAAAGKVDLCPDQCSKIITFVTKVDTRPSKEKGEFSQSSKSSIGGYSSSTSISEESNISGSGRSGYRPHMSKDLRWEAIRHVQKLHGCLSVRNLKVLRRLGCGDIGTVYLAELISTNCLFALKVMDREFLVSRKKMQRAQTEREIMQMLDHPFLPTLYSHFTTEKLSCLVMEYCPGGDLHVLRQKQPGRCFSEQAARFYVAEVLLALEYLHMLGVVYRDLKPENILVREDGHIMLTDFDLSLRCAANPTLLRSSPPSMAPPKKISTPCTDSSCIDPFCLHPSWQVSCFTPRLKSDLATHQINPLPQLIVEPTSARSNSFVGTHEYLAPEIIKGEGHGSAVDWWTFGIFLYELLYGKTPFKGSGNDDTLTNVVSRSLRFPGSPIVSFHARDLMRGLLVKEPENRLGSVKGAAEIKRHPFFEGLNWALIRCATPPELPKCDEIGMDSPALASQTDRSGEESEFHVF